MVVSKLWSLVSGSREENQNMKKKNTKTRKQKFESQTKTNKMDIQEVNGGEDTKLRATDWLSSLRGRLRQAYGPSSESQSHRADQFGHY